MKRPCWPCARLPAWGALLLLVLAAPPPLNAATVRTSLQARASAGYDSNPLRLRDAGPGGTFGELRLSTGAGVVVNPRLAFLVDAGAVTRRHDGEAAHANMDTWDLRAGLRLAPIRGQRHRLQVDAGATYEGRRLTFTDRATGAPYVITEDPNANPPLTRAIGERLDADATGAYLDLRWTLGPRLALFARSLLQHEDYREDYRDSQVLDSLDNRRVSVTPGAEIALAGDARLSVSYTHTELDYDERPARDASGGSAPEPASYRFSGWQTSLTLQPARRWRAGFGLAATDRNDRFAGYYSYADRAAFGWISREAGNRGRWLLFATRRDLAYDRATVTSDPDGELRGSDLLRALGRYEHKMTSRLSLLAEAGTQSVDNPDPLFAYDRSWAMVGMKYKQ